MNRKKFIQSSVGTMAALGLPIMAQANRRDEMKKSIIPPYLKSGDMIGITSPAGFISREGILPAAILMQQWGYKIRVGFTIGKRDFTYGGTDEERLTDFQMMLDDPNIKAIMCARGGYGSIRIVDKLKWDKFKANPKWIIGFSDITVLHAYIHEKFGIATIHSKMCNSFPDIWAQAEALQKDTIESINRALSGVEMGYTATPNILNKAGIAKGVLVGGNLKTLESLSGSNADICTKDKILFVEDTGEYLYSIDRMFWNLKRSGKLSHLAGLIVGGMKIKQDPVDEQFGKSVYEIVLEKVKEYNYPVCFDFPVGHQINNYALRCGVMHNLRITDTTVTLNAIQ